MTAASPTVTRRPKGAGQWPALSTGYWRCVTFEKGRRRGPVSLLPVIAQALDTTLDALIAHDAAPAVAPKKRGPQKKLRQQLEIIEALPIAKQRFITQMIDSVLAGQQ